jgi:dTDP-4-dehydrorhamnose 3,5-epimerase-like enzyme
MQERGKTHPLKTTRCQTYELPKVTDRRGSLTFVEGGRHLPFEIKRVFYLYGVPEGAQRAAHALRTCHQFMAAISGRLTVLTDDGRHKGRFVLDRPDCGVHVPPLVWRELVDFSPGAVCMVLASEYYDEDDYLNTYEDMLQALRSTGK